MVDNNNQQENIIYIQQILNPLYMSYYHLYGMSNFMLENVRVLFFGEILRSLKILFYLKSLVYFLSHEKYTRKKK